MSKLVYIAEKFRGENAWEIHQNVLRAEEATIKLIGEGYAVICPHKITENMQGLYPDDVYLYNCEEILSGVIVSICLIITEIPLGLWRN